MDIAKEHVEYISTQLESKVVTYHTAARDLGIHVSKSKTVLLEYYQANKTRVSASFIATGTRQGNLLVRVFESEADLTEKCRLAFDVVLTVHVYCLLLAKNSFSHSEIAMEERKHAIDFSKLADYHSLGLIKGPELERTKAKQAIATATSTPTRTPIKSSTAEPKKADTPTKSEKTAEKPKFVYQSRKQQPKTSMLSNYVSRKAEKKTTTTTDSSVGEKRPAPEKPLYEYKSRKLESLQPKERVVVSNIDPEDDIAEEAVEAAPAPKLNVTESELQNMFLDDFTDDDEKKNDAQDMEVDEPIVVEHVEKDQGDEDEQSKETQAETQQTALIPKDDIWKSMTSNAAAATPETEKQASPAPETTVDDDGYFTLYKKSDPKPEPMKRKPTQQPKPAKPAKKGDGKKKQASVMSFFQKR